MTFSRIHFASHTMVRLLPLPCVCQMMPPSRRCTRTWAACTPKYWLWRQIFLTPAVEDDEVVDDLEEPLLAAESVPAPEAGDCRRRQDELSSSFQRSQYFSGVSITP